MSMPGNVRIARKYEHSFYGSAVKEERLWKYAETIENHMRKLLRIDEIWRRCNNKSWLTHTEPNKLNNKGEEFKVSRLDTNSIFLYKK